MKWFACLLLGAALPLAAADTGKTHKDLIDYIRNAQSLGLKESQIKENAVKAGWDKGSVDQAFTIVNYLNTATTRERQSAPPGQAPAKSSVVVPDDYRIGAGDIIGIFVWKEPDASVPETVVRADGRITLPLIKETEVVGHTPIELEKELTAKFSHFIHDADVTVVVKEINSRKVYMIGAVKREGPLLLVAPMTVLQAITEAGGLTDYAKKKKIYVLRTEKGKQLRLPFDYSAVIRGQNGEQNVPLQPGDSIVIPH